jgi:protein ImuB
VAEVPDGPPVLFRWRGQAHKVARADGPERIAPEWWRQGTAAQASQASQASLARQTRDYYCIEDPDGRRFWLYRDGLYGVSALEEEAAEAKQPRWYLHGLFP